MKTAELAALYITCLLGIMPIAASAQPYAISTDGGEVTDQKTGLIWQRCAEGMVLSGGTCTGSAKGFTHEAALQWAAAQASSTGKAWRLPNVKELFSIADKSRGVGPLIDPNAFPATPPALFWSASPVGGRHIYAWFVAFEINYQHVLNYGSRDATYYVRLVRAGQ